MCIEHVTHDCAACGKDYLVYVEFCKEFHPPLTRCPNGTIRQRMDMDDGGCPSPTCPNSRHGGCNLM
ncbi:hypothetical protein B0T09DRAFT_359058 [Sordaria sp. MPI-SDFR-AT-0083]|nr:hypothetical protein B0T09DRAFT_359058 [Sordaria sp. MPI-SDFR-AT-0083]